MRSGEEGQRDKLDRHLAIVGKGVCFDSGGISIKPSDRMEEMKMDKTGACTVIAAIETVARLRAGTPLLAVAPAVENMPGPHSTRPGDIVTALNGKKVDITNTDAEGRLILGDAMTYAERLGATHLVDVATLTGAVARALGHLVTGAFGQPQGCYDEIVAAGRRAGERYWQLPLIEDYVPDMESWYADFQNAGAADGSLVKSALFLRSSPRFPGSTSTSPGRAITARRCRSRRAARPASRMPRSWSWPWPGPPAVVPSSVVPGDPRAGAVLGVAADRFATRWPEHDEEHPPGRKVDWRTVVCGAMGASPWGCCPLRFAGDTLALVRVRGLVRDADRRARDRPRPARAPRRVDAAGRSRSPWSTRSRVSIRWSVGRSCWRSLAAVLIPAVLYLPSIPFGAGAFGIGDVKLLAGMDLMVGASARWAARSSG